MAKRNRNKKTRPAAAHSRPAASAASTALMPEPLLEQTAPDRNSASSLQTPRNTLKTKGFT